MTPKRPKPSAPKPPFKPGEGGRGIPPRPGMTPPGARVGLKGSAAANAKAEIAQMRKRAAQAGATPNVARQIGAGVGRTMAAAGAGMAGMAGRSMFSKGGAVKSSDKAGRALKRKTADAKGRAMKKGK